MTFSFVDFVDMHTHILPGLDDGSKDMAESLSMARCYESAGVKTLVATPHFIPGTAWATPRERVLEAVQVLQAELDKANIDLTVLPGMEIAYHRKLEERLLAERVLPLGRSGYYLIEPSLHGGQEELLMCLRSLLDKGHKLILAHPERVDFFQRTPQVLQELVDSGLRIQVTAGSLLGQFGARSRTAGEVLRQDRCIHLIASDAHDSVRRRPLGAAEWEHFLAAPGCKELMISVNRNISEIFRLDREMCLG